MLNIWYCHDYRICQKALSFMLDASGHQESLPISLWFMDTFSHSSPCTCQSYIYPEREPPDNSVSSIYQSLQEKKEHRLAKTTKVLYESAEHH